MTRLAIIGFTFALALGWNVAAEATGLRIGGGVGAVRERIPGRSLLPGGPGVSTGAPCRDHGGRWTCVQPPAQTNNHIIIVPQPIYVAPSRNCFVPGYWTYQWVPQTSWHTAYVPGYWAIDGTWVDSHYNQQPYTTGSYHPVWVPDRWAC